MARETRRKKPARRPKPADARPSAAPSPLGGLWWPPIPDGRAAQTQAIIFQLEQSQWWPEERLRARQLEQIRLLAEHAHGTAPYYRRRLAAIVGLQPGKLTMDLFRQVPPLRRVDIQQAGDGLFSRQPPREHGGLHDVRTSGSTGQPVHVKTTDAAGLVNSAISLRYHLWHRRDLMGKNITIKALKSDVDVQRGRSWVPGFSTGPALVFNNAVAHDKLFDMVIGEDPHYLQCHPFTLRELIRHSREKDIKPKSLREIRTSSEVLDPELRQLCRKHWDLPVSDNYSSEEFGIMSLQCPDHPHGHIQAEKVLVEIIDDEDKPCPPGRMGRLLVTSLHNFATPLIRYELGDYGELGPACPCGRGLPVLKRIAGRERNLVVLPTGEKLFPVLDSEPVIHEMPVKQFQLIQTTLEQIEMKLVVERPLEKAEEDRLREYYCRNFRYPFRFKFTYVDEIPRGAGGKFEQFLSLVGGR